METRTGCLNAAGTINKENMSQLKPNEVRLMSKVFFSVLIQYELMCLLTPGQNEIAWNSETLPESSIFQTFVVIIKSFYEMISSTCLLLPNS